MKIDLKPRKNITILDYLVAIIPLNKVNDKIKDLLVLRRTVKNWYSILIFRSGFKKTGFVMQLRDGKKIEIRKPEDYFSFWDHYFIKIDKRVIRFKFGSKRLKFYYDSKKQLANTLYLIKEQFIEKQYNLLNIKNRIVVDIGANIGDSAIYFALKGAKKVYAFEPYPYSYKLAMRNIRLNKLQNRIKLLNLGCYGKEGKIMIDTSYKNSSGADLKNFENGTVIHIITLGDLIRRFDIPKGAVLKMDCEGCEYGVLLEARNSDLRKFKQIVVEYHYGYLNIYRKLKAAGFRVTRTMPKYIINSEAENKEMIIGLIYAEI
jgi:FkbM family methyltransferase